MKRGYEEAVSVDDRSETALQQRYVHNQLLYPPVMDQVHTLGFVQEGFKRFRIVSPHSSDENLVQHFEQQQPYPRDPTPPVDDSIHPEQLTHIHNEPGISSPGMYPSDGIVHDYRHDHIMSAFRNDSIPLARLQPMIPNSGPHDQTFSNDQRYPQAYESHFPHDTQRSQAAQRKLPTRCTVSTRGGHAPDYDHRTGNLLAVDDEHQQDPTYYQRMNHFLAQVQMERHALLQHPKDLSEEDTTNQPLIQPEQEYIAVSQNYSSMNDYLRQLRIHRLPHEENQ